MYVKEKSVNMDAISANFFINVKSASVTKCIFLETVSNVELFSVMEIIFLHRQSKFEGKELKYNN